jgi:hypothetical protein
MTPRTAVSHIPTPSYRLGGQDRIARASHTNKKNTPKTNASRRLPGLDGDDFQKQTAFTKLQYLQQGSGMGFSE